MRINWRARLTAFPLLFLLGLIGNSCSGFSTAYRFLDYYALYKIDEYFDVSDAQDSTVEAFVEKNYRWHRYEDLPRIIVFCECLIRETKNGAPATPESINSVRNFYVETRTLYAERMVGDISKFLAGLSKTQINHLKQKLVEGNKALYEELEDTDDEIKAAKINRFVDRVEQFFGNMSDEQKKHLAETYYFSRKNMLLRIESRLYSQKLFSDFLEEGKSADEIAVRLNTWIAYPETIRLPEYNTVLVENRKRANNMMFQIVRTLTQEQKNYFIEYLQNIITDLKNLSQA